MSKDVICILLNTGFYHVRLQLKKQSALYKSITNEVTNYAIQY